MPLVPFDSLPDSARVWVFAADPPLSGATADHLLAEVDRFLNDWKAHGVPLRCARDWREERFLTVGVDPSTEQASGCSIDGLFRSLQRVETHVGARLVGGGRVFYRDASGAARVARQDELEALVGRGEIAATTPVFDTTITVLADWRARFERPAGTAKNVLGNLLTA